MFATYFGVLRNAIPAGAGTSKRGKAETREHCNHRSHARMQNCGSMRAEACSDRVNTPRIVSFSKARMFHGSRSSAIPFYLLFRNSGTRQQCPGSGQCQSYLALFPSFLTTFRMPVLECVFLFALFRERS